MRPALIAQTLRLGELAQLGERLVCNQEVTGSIPVFSTNLRNAWQRALQAGKPAKAVRRSAKRRRWTNKFDGFLTTEYSAIGSFLTTYSWQSGLSGRKQIKSQVK